jgi:histone H3/H4
MAGRIKANPPTGNVSPVRVLGRKRKQENVGFLEDKVGKQRDKFPDPPKLVGRRTTRAGARRPVKKVVVEEVKTTEGRSSNATSSLVPPIVEIQPIVEMENVVVEEPRRKSNRTNVVKNWDKIIAADKKKSVKARPKTCRSGLGCARLYLKQKYPTIRISPKSKEILNLVYANQGKDYLENLLLQAVKVSIHMKRKTISGELLRILYETRLAIDG